MFACGHSFFVYDYFYLILNLIKSEQFLSKMYSLKSTYKQVLIFLFLSAYLCCTLSVPIFEGLHFLMHLGDDTQTHSFQSHQSLHDHQILTALNDLVDDNSPSEVPVETSKKIKVKKLVQISTILDDLERPLFEGTTQNFKNNIQFYTSPLSSILAPPPKV